MLDAVLFVNHQLIAREVCSVNILVTGGLGFIGSHTCVALLEAGNSVVIADNLTNSSIDVLFKIRDISRGDAVFYEADLTDKIWVDKIFAENKLDGVIHFAGLKAVGESLKTPLLYYFNNLQSTMTILSSCLQYGVNRFVFSSSATVYGDNQTPLSEDMALKPTINPYGESKVINEKILSDVAMAYPELSVSLLRYFNPVGAHESGLIGENPCGIPNNLMPLIVRAASGELDCLHIFGGDYDTYDGTCIRDYIHVMDVAEGHVAALENLQRGVNAYNLGTGRGTSVLELIHTFEEANDISVPYRLVGRRAGDIAVCYADVSKAERCLGWKAKRTLFDMCRDSWRFQLMNSSKLVKENNIGVLI